MGVFMGSLPRIHEVSQICMKIWVFVEVAELIIFACFGCDLLAMVWESHALQHRKSRTMVEWFTLMAMAMIGRSRLRMFAVSSSVWRSIFMVLSCVFTEIRGKHWKTPYTRLENTCFFQRFWAILKPFFNVFPVSQWKHMIRPWKLNARRYSTRRTFWDDSGQS